MKDDNFGFAGSDDDYVERFERAAWSHPEDCSSVDSLDFAALELWLNGNHGLWKMGLRLATMARQYKREYRNIPFNQIGWFCPN